MFLRLLRLSLRRRVAPEAILLKITSLFILLWLAGCAGYAERIRTPRSYLERGNYDAAISSLKPLVESKDNDQLLYLMDLGLVYHAAGQYEQAVSTFLKAEEFAAAQDYTSITQEAGSVLVNDDVARYKGEDFEKILINVYLAIDFTLMGKWDSALVECRKINHKLDLLIAKGQIPDERNAFAKYLAAALFEARGETDSAFVDYRQLLKWPQSVPYLAGPLLRIADLLKASQEYESYVKKFPDEKDFRLGKSKGELILIVELGKVPIKVPSPQFHLVPMMSIRGYSSGSVVLHSPTVPGEWQSQKLYDIERTAINELNHKIAAIAAKKAAGIVAKELAGAAVAKATDNKFLGFLTALFLRASDKADLRSWSTLPAELQLIRVKLPVGTHKLVLDVLPRQGERIVGLKSWENVAIKPGQITFLNVRVPD
jgi:hypothetical protein